MALIFRLAQSNCLRAIVERSHGDLWGPPVPCNPEWGETNDLPALVRAQHPPCLSDFRARPNPFARGGLGNLEIARTAGGESAAHRLARNQVTHTLAT